MIINYLKQMKQFIFLNLFFSFLVTALFFEAGIISGFENLMFLIMLSGFIVSFFIKENLFTHYIKVVFLNSLFFGFLLSLFFILSGLINDSLFRESFCIHHFYFFISSIFLIGLCNFFGGLAGITICWFQATLRTKMH